MTGYRRTDPRHQPYPNPPLDEREDDLGYTDTHGNQQKRGPAWDEEPYEPSYRRAPGHEPHPQPEYQDQWTDHGTYEGFDQGDRRHNEAGGDFEHGPRVERDHPYYRAEEAGNFVDEDDEDGEGPWQAVDDDERPRGRRRLAFGAGFALLLVTAGSFWWFSSGAPDGGLAEQAPLITATPGPFKERPLEAGGLEVPHQDRQILQTLGGRHAPDRVERLLPGPEEPVPIAGLGDQTVDSADTADLNLSSPVSDGEEDGLLPLIPEGATAATSDGAATQANRLPDGDEDASTVGFDGREDQIAALIESMGILDDDFEASEQPDENTSGGDDEANDLAALSDTVVGTQSAEGEDTSSEESGSDPVDTISPVADGGFRIQLASVDSQDAARSEWTRLNSRFADLLGQLTMDVQEADISGRTWYRVQAGPLDREMAERVCSELEARNAGCMVVRR